MLGCVNTWGEATYRKGLIQNMIFEGCWRVRIFRAVCKLSLQDTQTRSKKKPVLVVSLSLVHPSRLCEPLTSRVLTLEKSCSVAGLFCELPGDDDEMMMVLFYANANQRTRALMVIAI